MTAKECPTDLIAKERHVGLSPREKRLLDEHLMRCRSCRTWKQLGRDFDDEAQIRPSDAELLTRITGRLPQKARLAGVPTEVSLRPNMTPERVTLRRPTRRRRGLYVGIGLGLLATAAAAAVIGLSLKPQPPEVDPQWVRSTRENGPVAALQPARLSAGAPDPSDAKSTNLSHDEKQSLPSESVALALNVSPQVVATHERSTPGTTPLELYRKANLARRAQASGKAIELFAELQSRFPQSSEARLALVPFGNTLLDRGQAAAALKKFERYLRSGDTALSAEALYGQARALSVVGTKGDQSHAWQRLLDRYPSSPYASIAQRKLEALH